MLSQQSQPEQVDTAPRALSFDIVILIDRSDAPGALGAAESLVDRAIVVQFKAVCFLAFPPVPAVQVVLVSAALLRTAEASTSRVVESLWNRISRSAAVPYPKHRCRTASDTTYTKQGQQQQ